MNSPTQRKIEEIKLRLEKATPGPWYVIAERNNRYWPDGAPDTHWVCPQPTLPGDYIFVMDNISKDDAVNADFIAHAPTDLSLLLRIVEIQAKALEEIKSDECRKHSCHECDHCGADMNDLKHLARQAIAEVNEMINQGRKE